MSSKRITQAELGGSFCPFQRLGDELLEIRSGLVIVISSDSRCADFDHGRWRRDGYVTV
jgi:hypothetical protein